METNNANKVIRGYKVFNPDWTCKDFQFEVGKTFTEDVTPICCFKGFHFCTNAADCFKHYAFRPDNKVAEVEALGDIDTDDNSQYCTNKIKIIRELTWHEVLNLVNIGKACTGYCNSGDYNSGSYNSGDCNSGSYNSSGRNSGSYNSGSCNSGDYNSGNHNSGSYNSGDWNKTCFSNGCFNTESPKIFMFNKPSAWTYRDWISSKARYILLSCPSNVLHFIPNGDMTNEERKQYPEYSVTGGFLKYVEKETRRQMWWKGLSDSEKDIVMQLPNFDKDIFKEITGITVD